MGGCGLVPASGLQAQASAQLLEEGPGSGWAGTRKDPPQEAWREAGMLQSASHYRVSGGLRRGWAAVCLSCQQQAGVAESSRPGLPGVVFVTSRALYGPRWERASILLLLILYF